MKTTSQRFTTLLGGGLILLFSLVAISRVGAQTCVQPPSGLVSWWPGDGDANDIQDSNPGIQNGATFATGIVGQAFSFDGTDDFVQVSHNANLNPGSADFTVNFWMRTTFLGFGAVLNKRPSCPAPSFWDFRFGGAICGELAESGVGGNYNPVCSSIPVNDGSWHHIALSRQGTTATLYIDGAVEGSGSTSGVTNIVNTADLLFGNDPCVQFGDGTQFYQGELDEIQYFNRALTQTEIQAIFNAGSAGKCK